MRYLKWMAQVFWDGMMLAMGFYFTIIIVEALVAK